MSKAALSALARALALAAVATSCGGTEHPPDASTDSGSVVDTGTVVSGGFSLRYIVEGTGEPALVVGSAPYYARAFSQNLRQHLRLAFMDHRGFAPSPGPRDTTAFALDSLVDDMERVRAHLRLGRVIVVGHSGHAYMALEYAKKYPQHVSHAAMIGIAPDLSAASAEETTKYWDTTASNERKGVLEDNIRRVPDSALAQLPPGQGFIQAYIRNGPRAWYDPRFDSSPLWDGVGINMDMFNYVWGQVFRDIDITRGLTELDRPVFVALGRFDYLVAPPATWERVRGAFRDVTIRVFDKSGHTPQYEEASLFDTELLAWLGRPQ
jgi:proline iminopeptidase